MSEGGKFRSQQAENKRENNKPVNRKISTNKSMLQDHHPVGPNLQHSKVVKATTQTEVESKNLE